MTTGKSQWAKHNGKANEVSCSNTCENHVWSLPVA